MTNKNKIAHELNSMLNDITSLKQNTIFYESSKHGLLIEVEDEILSVLDSIDDLDNTTLQDNYVNIECKFSSLINQVQEPSRQPFTPNREQLQDQPDGDMFSDKVENYIETQNY